MSMRGLMRGAAIAALLGAVLGVGSACATVANMRSTWDPASGNLYWWDARTSRLEYKGPYIAPVSYFDDFLGLLPLSAADSNNGWTIVDVNGGTEIQAATGAENGIAQLALSAVHEAQDAVLYWGDASAVAVDQAAIFECYANMAVVPGSQSTVVWGMAGAHNLDKDTITEAAWFRLQGSAVLVVETDDTTNDEDDVATGVTMVAGTYYNFKIDFSTQTDVKFYVNDVQVGTTTTFDMSNLTSDEAVMQPYLSLDKPTGLGAGTLNIDWVSIQGNR